jgi:hypothetical protein
MAGRAVGDQQLPGLSLASRLSAIIGDYLRRATWRRFWLLQAINLAAALLGSATGRQVAEWLGIRLPWPIGLAGGVSFAALAIWRDHRKRAKAVTSRESPAGTSAGPGRTRASAREARRPTA